MSSSNGDEPMGAYEQLEATVRRFSRERLDLHEQVSKLLGEIQTKERELQERDGAIQRLTLEKDNLLNAHLQDEQNRLSFDTKLSGIVDQMKMLVDAAPTYDSVLEDQRNQAEGYAQSITQVKRRQLQIYQAKQASDAANVERLEFAAAEKENLVCQVMKMQKELEILGQKNIGKEEEIDTLIKSKEASEAAHLERLEYAALEKENLLSQVMEMQKELEVLGQTTSGKEQEIASLTKSKEASDAAYLERLESAAFEKENLLCQVMQMQKELEVLGQTNIGKEQEIASLTKSKEASDAAHLERLESAAFEKENLISQAMQMQTELEVLGQTNIGKEQEIASLTKSKEASDAAYLERLESAAFEKEHLLCQVMQMQKELEVLGQTNIGKEQEIASLTKSKEASDAAHLERLESAALEKENLISQAMQMQKELQVLGQKNIAKEQEIVTLIKSKETSDAAHLERLESAALEKENLLCQVMQMQAELQVLGLKNIAKEEEMATLIKSRETSDAAHLEGLEAAAAEKENLVCQVMKMQKELEILGQKNIAKEQEIASVTKSKEASDAAYLERLESAAFEKENLLCQVMQMQAELQVLGQKNIGKEEKIATLIKSKEASDAAHLERLESAALEKENLRCQVMEMQKELEVLGQKNIAKEQEIASLTKSKQASDASHLERLESAAAEKENLVCQVMKMQAELEILGQKNIGKEEQIATLIKSKEASDAAHLERLQSAALEKENLRCQAMQMQTELEVLGQKNIAKEQEIASLTKSKEASEAAHLERLESSALEKENLISQVMKFQEQLDVLGEKLIEKNLELSTMTKSKEASNAEHIQERDRLTLEKENLAKQIREQEKQLKAYSQTLTDAKNVAMAKDRAYASLKEDAARAEKLRNSPHRVSLPRLPAPTRFSSFSTSSDEEEASASSKAVTNMAHDLSTLRVNSPLRKRDAMAAGAKVPNIPLEKKSKGPLAEVAPEQAPPATSVTPVRKFFRHNTPGDAGPIPRVPTALRGRKK